MWQLFLIIAIKVGLYLSSRATLPWLFVQARHASLEAQPRSASSLPTPATSSSLPTSTSYSDSLHDNHDTAPFLSTSRNKAPSLGKIKSAVLSPVRIRNAQGSLDLSSFTALLFSLAFEESATLFVAVLLEAAEFDTSESSALRVAWRLSILGVLALTVVVIPLGICLLFTYRSNSSTPLLRRIIFLCLPFIPWLVLFFSVPLPKALTSPDSKSGIVDSLLARTAVIGVTLIALLSGSAALAAAWEAGEAFRGKSVRPPSPSDVRLAEESFTRTCNELSSKKSAIERLEQEIISERQSGGAGWSLSNIWSGDIRSREIKTLKSEIFGLSAIALAIRDDLDHMRKLQVKEERSHTFGGRILSVIGWVWAIYCAFRILLSLLNLLILGYRDSIPPDFISYALASIMRIFDVDLDLSAWTRQISLLFIGILIWGRMSSVLSYLSNVFQAASTGVSTSFLVLFLAQVTTIYLLATLVQLKTSLQGQLLTTLPSFQVVFGSLFDTAFLLAAVATAGYKYFLETRKSHIEDRGVLFAQ